VERPYRSAKPRSRSPHWREQLPTGASERLRGETGELPVVNQSNCIPTSLKSTRWRTPRTRHHHRIVEPVGRGSDLLAIQSSRRSPRTRNHSRQAILAWHVSLGSIPIPKSKSLERQRQNLTIFDVSLTADNVDQIGTLARADGRLADQDPRCTKSSKQHTSFGEGSTQLQHGSSDFNVESATRHPTRMILHSLISTWPRERRRRSPRG